MSENKLALVVIDGQNDFLADGQGQERRGALCIDGAKEEAIKLAGLINRLGPEINAIFVTLDSHQRYDCSHNIAWKDKDGNTPPPFTIVTHSDVKNDLYLPRCETVLWGGRDIPSKEWAMKYTRELELEERPTLCLWPVHCQIGSWGSNIHPVLQEAYDGWCDKTGSTINYITKGTCPYTEHYSAFQAEVKNTSYPETDFNKEFARDLLAHKKLLWAGWAGSHCFRFSVDSFCRWWTEVNAPVYNKCFFLEDACAAVPDIPGAPFKFSEWRQSFLDDLRKKGSTITNTQDFKS